MKKLTYVVCAVLLTVVFAGVGWAVDKSNVGCGLGTLIFKNENGLMSQTAAATTNGFVGNQTFGITSGTIDCKQHTTLTYKEKVDTFVAENMGNLATDIARGQGEYLNTLALLMDVPATQKAAFGSLLQAHFSDIYTSDKVTHSEVVKNIVTVTATL
jgi:hypothetical protein